MTPTWAKPRAAPPPNASPMRGGTLIEGLGAGASGGTSRTGALVGGGVTCAGTSSEAGLFASALEPICSGTTDFSGGDTCTTRSAIGTLLGGAEAQAPSNNTTPTIQPVCKLRFMYALSLCDNEKTHCAGERNTQWHVRLPGQRKSSH